MDATRGRGAGEATVKLYRQCELVNGDKRRVAFIPNEKAKAGKILRIGDEDGWRVAKTYDVLSEEDLELQHLALKGWQSVLPDRKGK